MRGWLRLDLIRLLLLAAPIIVVHAVVVTLAPPTARPPWMVGLAVVTLGLVGMLASRSAADVGPRRLGRPLLAFVLGYVSLFALAADLDLLSGRRVPLAGFADRVPANVLGFERLGDWRYRLAPAAPEAGELIVVTLPSFAGMTRERARQRLRRIVDMALANRARGVALDIYLEQPSAYDPRLRQALQRARLADLPVVLGYRQVASESGLPIRSSLAPTLGGAIEHTGHLQGYRSADGRIRLIPAVLPGVGRGPALSVVVAGLLGGERPSVPEGRLLRFVRPRGGVPVVPFSDLDGRVLRDRFVLVGSAAEADRVPTPFGPLQGVEVHAWAAHSLAAGSALVDVDPAWTLPWIFTLCYVLVVLYTRGERPARLIVGAAVLSAAALAASLAALRFGRLWLEVSYPILAVWLLTAALVTVDALRRRRRRARARPAEAAGRRRAESPWSPDEGRSGFDVFLSHNGREKERVRELCAALRSRRLVPWLDEEQLKPGEDWQRALEEAIRTVPAFAVLVGSDGLGPWEVVETRAALSEGVRRGLVVVPVLLPEAGPAPSLPLFLTQYTWVDLRDGFTAAGLDRLEWSLTGRRPVAVGVG